MGNLSRTGYAALVIVLAVVAFMAVNIASNALFTTARLDLTENGLYTLDPGTRSTIAKIDEPITLKFYYSKAVAANYAQVSGYAKRVRDLLGEYAAISGGKIRVVDVDPEPFTSAEDEATGAGLSGAATDTGETVYFGLVGTNEIDGKEVIPYFSADREKYLEYDLTSLIYRLSHPKKPVVGIITALPMDTGAGGMAAMMQGGAQPYAIYTELSQTYKTEMIGSSFDQIPRDVDVLMIAHPAPLTDRQLYAIDQFVLKGGRALVFVDPMSELSQPQGGMDAQDAGPVQSDLPRLLQAWGVGYTPRKVVGDKALAQRVQSGDPNNPIALYPVWLHLTDKNFDSKDVVTATMQTLNLASVGALHPLKRATTTFTPLVSSSHQAGLVDVEQVRMNARPQDLLDAIRPTGETFTIAARISGPAKTAYPGLPASGGAKQITSGNINVIVMADSDIFDDRFWVHVDDLYGKKIASPFADNAAFVLNAVENLTGSSDLITLRTRATNDRPFTVVQQMQAEAGEEFQEQEGVLKARLTDTEQRLHELEQGGSVNGQPSNAAGLSAAQQSEIDKFKHQLAETRTALRDVQHNLRAQVDALGSLLAFINIALVPIFVAGFAIVLAFLRRRRRARARAL